MAEPRDVTSSIDAGAWLRERGWTEYQSAGGMSYWRTTPNESGWEGGWNLLGAVMRELESDNATTLKRMGLYRPPARSRRGR